MSGTGHGTRAILAAFLANLGIAIAKFVGFLITRSSSMLAESVHSLADTGNQGLLMLGGRRAGRAADVHHPFGYGRERYFWAFVVALVLFIGGAVFAVYEGIEKIRHPHELESAGIAVAILVVAIVLAVEMKSLLIGEAALPQDVEAIRQALLGGDHVTNVIHLRTEHLGPDELLVATKLAFQPSLTVPQLAVAIDDAEARVRAEVPSARLIYIEPDLQRSV